MINKSERIKCECGCGLERLRFDSQGRERRLIWKHGRKIPLDEREMRSKSAKQKGMGLWMKKVWAEGRASPNSLNGIGKNVKPFWKGKKFPQYLKDKLSQAHKGKAPWNKGKECLYQRGEKNNFWQGGISYLPYGIDFNKQFKEAIRIRDNDSCMICGSDIRLVTHHINYNKLNNTKDNCVLLCRSCHAKTNFNRQHWTKFFQSLLNEKYGYEYKMEVTLL